MRSVCCCCSVIMDALLDLKPTFNDAGYCGFDREIETAINIVMPDMNRGDQ